MLQQALDSGGRIAGDNAEIPESKPSISNGRGPAFPNAGQVQGSVLATSAANADVALSARRLSPGAEEVVSNNVSAGREGGPAGGTSGINSVRQRHEPQVRWRRLQSVISRTEHVRQPVGSPVAMLVGSLWHHCSMPWCILLRVVGHRSVSDLARPCFLSVVLHSCRSLCLFSPKVLTFLMGGASGNGHSRQCILLAMQRQSVRCLSPGTVCAAE